MEKYVRTTQYDLFCRRGEYGALRKALRNMNSFYTSADENGWEHYLVLDKSPVKISLRKLEIISKEPNLFEERVGMAVNRTTFFEPKFVRKIVKRLNGKSPGEGKKINSSMIDLFLEKTTPTFWGKFG
jgi:hypothetical protein